MEKQNENLCECCQGALGRQGLIKTTQANTDQQKICNSPMAVHKCQEIQNPPSAGDTVNVQNKNTENNIQENQEEEYTDFFFVEGLGINHEDIKSVILPKFILNHLNPNIGFSEKGLLLFTLDGNHHNGVYARVMELIKEGTKELKIHFYQPPNFDDNEDDEIVVLSIWRFTDLTVQTVDFGYAATSRPEPAEILLEFDYEKFEIDGKSF